jgi:Uma2 family endonuclease
MVLVEESYLPITLFAPGLTDEEFQKFCEQYEDYQLEYSAEGDLLIMPPTDAETGIRNSYIIMRLGLWAENHGHGHVTDSSAGFVLPNRARRSPDAAWISGARLQTPFACPEFVIELLSPTDRPKKVHEKMEEWLRNGVQLGWMIDPFSRSVSIYRLGQAAQHLSGIDSIAGEAPVAGFVLDLRRIWA